MKRKILIFTPGGVGGAERMSVLIGKLLPKDHFDVKFVIIGRLRNIFNILPCDYPVACIPVRNIYCFSTLRIWWKIIREKPEVVFTSQAAYNPRVILAARLAGKKVVVRSSGMIGSYRPRVFRDVKITYPLANIIIAQQEEMRNEIIHILKISPEKVKTIHNPLDYDNIDKLSKADSPFPKDGNLYFVQVASVNHRKAQDVAIKAFSIVNRSISKSQLYFVGPYDKNSDYFQELITLIKDLNLDRKVHFVGYDKNPFRWVKNADCFIFPSRNEGLPNALVEASYLGTPCAATRCLNIVDEIIKDGKNGFVINVDDIGGLAQAMMKAVALKKCEMIYAPSSYHDFVKVFNSIC